jgi:hypothetical protein
MDQNIPTLPERPLFKPFFIDALLRITTLLGEKSQRKLALLCKKSLDIYKNYFKKQCYIVLHSPHFNRVYSNYMKELLESYWCKTDSNPRDGWSRTSISIEVRALNNLGPREYPFVNSICLEAPFNLSRRTLENAKYINYVFLEFDVYKDAPTTSSLKCFSNSKSVGFFEATFNSDMLETISSFQSMDHILLGDCDMGNYLSEIANISHIKKFTLGVCTYTQIVKLPPQSIMVELLGICAEDLVDLSDCSGLLEL